jgi:hypothetical protein
MSIRAKRLASKAAILIVCGLAAFATGAIVVHAATHAQVSKKKRKKKALPSFYIRAQLDQQLSPGRSVPIKLSFANNQSKNVWLTRLAVTLRLDKAHSAAGCSVKRDYNVVQLPKKFFPLKLPKAKKPKKGKKVKLRYRAAPAKKAAGRPTLMMLAPAGVNQDACKGATLTLTYTTKSSTKRPRKVKAKRSVATQ